MAQEELSHLIARALASGIERVQAAGGRLEPFLCDETGEVQPLAPRGLRPDAMALAMRAIRERGPGMQRCAVVMRTRITTRDRQRWDAILAVACERDAEEGEAWAQRYRPALFFREFRAEPPEQVGKAKNFIRSALESA